MSRARLEPVARLRHRIHATLDGGTSDLTSRVVHGGLVGLVCASVVSVVLQTVPGMASRYDLLFLAVEALAVAAFTLEYVLRVWCAPDQTPYADLTPWRARLRFILTPSALVDLCSILPFYLAFFLPADLRVLVLLRLLRFFKLARYSAGMRSLIAALEAERKALFASAVVLLGLVLIAAAAMHLVEHEAQPDKFGSIPDAMWWAVVTLTTVGYGDVVPVTLAGRIVAGFTMLAGLMMLALPIGIVANAFAEEIHRREFVVTWGMIARVPLFASLSASEIAEVMKYLRAQTVPSETVIVRRGEAATSMYFIASGEVEIETRKGPVRLSEGHFFGELALLHRTHRTATVRALAPTKLLVLDAGDLHALMERNTEIAHRLQAIARERE
jgi:voltage-gated potassium channel